MSEVFPTADAPLDGGYVPLEASEEVSDHRPLPEGIVDVYDDTGIVNDLVAVPTDAELHRTPVSEFLDDETKHGSTLISSNFEGTIGEINVGPADGKNILAHGVTGGKHALAVSARMPDGRRKGIVQTFTDTDAGYVGTMLGLGNATDKRAVIMTPGESVQTGDDGAYEVQPSDPYRTALLQEKIQAAVGENAVLQVVSYDTAMDALPGNGNGNGNGAGGLRGILMVEFTPDDTTRIHVNGSILPQPLPPQEQ